MQIFGPNREEDYSFSKKFSSSFFQPIFNCTDRKAKISGISFDVCTAKKNEFIYNIEELAKIMDCELVRQMYEKMEPKIIKCIIDGNRHTLGFKENRDILTNGDTTNPDYPGGKMFYDQADARVERKEIRKWIHRVNKYCKTVGFENINNKIKHPSDCVQVIKEINNIKIT